VRRFLSGTGRVLITAGVLILLFVAYQLWGTGILQARAQDDLKSQFQRTLASAPSTSTTEPSTATTAPTTTTTTVPPPPDLPAEGDAVATIDIPQIGVSQYVVEGVGVADLRKGPGHYPATPLPGQEGNAAIAGHRTTYGAPFGDLEQLEAGDLIRVRTVQGVFTYKVSKDPFAVDPDDGSVLQPDPDPNRPGSSLATLTLTTCNPKYSAAERLIVQATLDIPPEQQPLPASVPVNAPRTIAGLGGETSSRSPALLWGFIALAVGLCWWWLFHRYKHWYVWFAGAIPFLAVLFVFYTYLERLLPANY